jgi:hypothetical protein
MKIKTMSQARRNLRKVLGALLLLSFGFFSTVVFFRIAVKNKMIEITEISKTLFELDILQHRAMATFSSQEEQLRIANKMIGNSLFDPTYGKAGIIMLDDLALSGHAPSQMAFADLIMRTKIRTKSEAEAYYKLAAAQGYIPARDRLEEIEQASTK